MHDETNQKIYFQKVINTYFQEFLSEATLRSATAYGQSLFHTSLYFGNPLQDPEYVNIFS